MNINNLLELAALNNAMWCQIVCEANGAPGKFATELWSSVYQVPRYYPNVVTLSPECGWEPIRQVIEHIPEPVSIKDSFNKLNCTDAGFTKLFEANWIMATEYCNPTFQFKILQTIDQLKQWEHAWSDGTVMGLFRATILKNPTVRFIALYHNNQITAGAIAHKSEGVIGLSNVFCKANQPDKYWLTCVAAAQAFEPGWPVVGYAQNNSLKFLKTIGFNELGPLAVWIKQN